MSKKKIQCYSIRKNAITIYQNFDIIWTDIHNFPESSMIFCEDEIIEETHDGILTILKDFYPKDGRHFFYVNRKDLICGAI